MDILQIALVVALGVAAVAFIILRQRGEYGKHVAQLQPKGLPKKKEKRFDEYTMEQVKEHNLKSDAWLVVKNREAGEWRVYDVTDFVDDHPGGEHAILRNSGGDATKGFYGPHHPDAVFVMMDDFCIGKLKDGEHP